MGSDIRAGTIDEFNPKLGDWLFVDVGFSSTRKSCGVLKNSERPWTETFGGLVDFVIQEFGIPGPPLNLVLEAPLSATFNKGGNPTARCPDKNRQWYLQPATTVMVATIRLLRRMNDFAIQREVRLFEGFASFKSSSTKWPYEKDYGFSKTAWPHIADVLRLRCAAWHPTQKYVVNPRKLKINKTYDTLHSILEFAGMESRGIPPVLMACECSHQEIRRHLLRP